MTIKEEIKQAIRTIIIREIKNLKISKDVISVVTAINGDKYKVNIDGTDYWVKDGIGLNLTIGMAVWVRIPNGNMNDIFIMSKK